MNNILSVDFDLEAAEEYICNQRKLAEFIEEANIETALPISAINSNEQEVNLIALLFGNI